MMEKVITIFLALAVLFSGIFAVTTSVLFQSVTVLITGLACLMCIFSKPKLQVDLRLLVISLVGFGYFTVRAYFSPVYDLGVSDLFLFLPASAIYFLSIFGYVSRKYFFWLIVSAVSVLAVLNLLMFIPPINEFRDDILPFAKGNSESGLYNHRNFCSNFLMMAMLLSFSIGLLFTQIKWIRLFFLLLGIGCLFGLSQATARGGMVGAVAGIFVMGLCFLIMSKLSMQKKITYSALIAVIVLAGLGAAYQVFSKRESSLANLSDLGARTSYFAMAIDQTVEAPIIGSGSMSYSYLSYLNWGDFGTHYLDHVWVHNEFLQALADYGILGLLIILVFFCYCIYQFYKTFEHSILNLDSISNQLKLKIIGLSAFIGFSINACVSFPAHAQPNMMVFTFCLVLLSLSRKEVPTGRAINWISRLALAAIAFISFNLGIKDARALTILGKEGIFVDNANWSNKDHTRNGWKEGLYKTIATSPNFLRYERVSSILLTEFASSDQESFVVVEKALKYALLSIERHPYHAPAIGNAANCLRILGRFGESDVYYTKLVKLTSRRQNFFEPYNKWARLKYDWALFLANEGNTEAALSKSKEGWQHLMKSDRRNYNWRVTLIGMLKIMNQFEMVSGHAEELSDRMNLTYEKILINAWNEKNLKLLKFNAIILNDYANYLFINRKPSQALKWFARSYKCCKNYFSQVGVGSDDASNKMMKQVYSKINLLRNARITPAK